MFDHVRQAVENGEVLLEKGTQGDSDKPLVKDGIAPAERRRAKTLNFSIAYGKAVHGLAKDWASPNKKLKACYGGLCGNQPVIHAISALAQACRSTRSRRAHSVRQPHKTVRGSLEGRLNFDFLTGTWRNEVDSRRTIYDDVDGSTSTVAGLAGKKQSAAGARRARGDQHADSRLRAADGGGDGHARYW